MKALLIILPLFYLTACNDVIEYNYWDDGSYYITDNLGGADVKTLYIKAGGSNGHGRVDYVNAIGSNSTYIIVRSNHREKHYWILNKKKDKQELNAVEIVEGPFSYAEFTSRKKELHISQLRFTQWW